MPYSKSFWGVDDSGSWVLVAIARRRQRRWRQRRVVVAIAAAAAAAVKQGKRLRINIASFILNEAGFTAAHPPKHSPPHGVRAAVCRSRASSADAQLRAAPRRAAAAALKYIYGCCKRAVGSLTQVSAALLSTDHAAVARESNNEQVVTK